MNYKVEKQEKGWALIESSTGHIVDYYNDRGTARYKGKFMSSGGAFNGFTPQFMCRSISENVVHTENQTLVEPDSEQEQDLNHQFSVQVVRNQS